MANRNPVVARRGKARKRLESMKTKDMKDFQRGLSLVWEELTDRVGEDITDDDLHKITTSLVKVANAYTDVFRAVELEARLDAAETAMQKGTANRMRGGAFA